MSTSDPTTRDIWKSYYALCRQQANKRQRRSRSAAVVACGDMREDWHGAPIYFVVTRGGRFATIYGPCGKLP